MHTKENSIQNITTYIFWSKLKLVYCTVKSRLSERLLSETTGLFEDYGQSGLFSLLSIAIKLPIIRISIIRKIQFFRSDSSVLIKEIAIK